MRFAPRDSLSVAAIGVLLVAYAFFIFSNIVEVAGGADSSGYLNEAKLLARGDVEEPIGDVFEKFHLEEALNVAFMPLGYTLSPPRMIKPTYPPGLPIHMMLFAKAGGWKHAPFWVAPIASLFAIALIALLAKLIFDSWAYALAAALALASCAVFVYHAIQPLSDVVVTAWSIAAILFALRSRDGNRWLAAAAAIALGISAWVRPTNAILGIAFLAALGFRKRTFIPAAIAGALVIAPLLAWNNALYGGPFKSGYGPLEELFAWSYFPIRFVHYLKWTGAQLSPFALIGAVWSLIRARRDATHRMLALWWWPFFIFYCFYGPYETWWYTRFLLPAYPALIISTLLAARELDRRIAPAVVTAAMVACSISVASHFQILETQYAESIYPLAVRWSEADLPDDALVIGTQLSGARKYYRNRLMCRWEMLDADRVARLERAIPPDRWYAVLFGFEVDEVKSRTPNAEWTKIAEFRDIGIWHRTR
jgi:hypothetical protein